MAFCEMKYFSTALAKQTSANIIVPEGPVPGPYAVYYLLHGLSDDHTIWMRRTSIERYVADLPMMVVMPDGARSFYIDAADGPAYETAIVKDLVDFIDRTFPTIADRSGRCIGGLSMGGYGALHLSLAHPDLFGSANSHSGALGFGSRALPRDEDWSREFRHVLGPRPKGGPNDLLAQVETADPALLPAMRIDCGTEDSLLQENRVFHHKLTKLGIQHEYQEFPGCHEWSYWDEHVREAIAFHVRTLNIGHRA